MASYHSTHLSLSNEDKKIEDIIVKEGVTKIDIYRVGLQVTREKLISAQRSANK